MKKTSAKIATALIAAQSLLGSLAFAADPKPKAAVAEKDPQGQCWGVVGKGEGDCGGKDPKTGEAWSCAGNNPSADLGWKKMKKSECDAMAKHKDAKAKKFVAEKAG